MDLSVKVSVLTSLYKHHPRYVRQCFESLRAQTLQECEFILIDNGADENNKSLIEEYVAKDSRFKSLHLKKNAGCSSLQAEVFYANDAPIPPAEEVLASTIEKLKSICNFTDEDIVVKDIRFEPYANVAFTHPIYENRRIIHDYLDSLGIEYIGRFGKWDYLWSFQAFKTGIEI